MARKPRKYGETGIYHVILRGNNQENLFYDDSDRLFFLNRLEKYVKQLDIELYSYCLMGNHVHLLIGNGNEHMSLFVKKITCSYVYYFNHKYERSGHLFQGRYKSEPVEEVNYFKIVYRYILHNPEKAGICLYNKYKWSSYYLIKNNNEVINTDFSEVIFGSVDKLFDFLRVRSDDSCMEDIYQKPENNDELMILFVKQLLKCNSPLDIGKMPFLIMRNTIKLLKNTGMTISQISRLTNISKKIIRDA